MATTTAAQAALIHAVAATTLAVRQIAVGVAVRLIPAAYGRFFYFVLKNELTEFNFQHKYNESSAGGLTIAEG
ncbi:MAG: hypothetical protein E6663_01350 [Staphylococcus lugdunensis]|nr:hypothetical protein [Staphylococcus lugdunensis]